MRVQESIRFSLLLLTTIALVLGNGCRSMSNGESFWKRPNLSSFAFGKKKDDSVPKPPALHFDPTPANSETELAARKNATKNTTADLKNSLNSLAKAESDVPASPDAKPVAEAAANKLQPLRTPYQLSGKSADQKTGSATGKPSTSPVAGLASTTGQSDFRLPETLKQKPVNQMPAVAKSADQARAQFNSDMKNLSSTAKSKAGVAGSSLENDLAALAKKTEDKAGAVSDQTANGIAASEKRMSEEQRRLKAEVAKAKQEIAELKTQLKSNNQMLNPIGAAQAGAASGSFGAKPTATQVPVPQAAGNPFQIAASQDFSPTGLKPNSVSPSAVAGQSKSPTGNFSQNGFEPLRPNSNVDMSGSRGVQSPPRYPSTAHGGFAPAASTSTPNPDTNIQRVGLQAPVGSMGESQQAFGSATADIDIPESVLRGTGSFSPGSVNRLRGN